METYQSFARLSYVTYFAVNGLVLYYAFPRWRRTRHRFLLFFCLSAFIGIVATVIGLTSFMQWEFQMPAEIFFCFVSAAYSISNVFTGMAIFWMMQHYRNLTNSAPDGGGESPENRA